MFIYLHSGLVRVEAGEEDLLQTRPRNTKRSFWWGTIRRREHSVKDEDRADRVRVRKFHWDDTNALTNSVSLPFSPARLVVCWDSHVTSFARSIWVVCWILFHSPEISLFVLSKLNRYENQRRISRLEINDYITFISIDFVTWLTVWDVFAVRLQ